jgi:ribose transport system ATP-binding protein
MDSPSPVLLAAEGVFKTYGNNTVLRGASVQLHSGHVHTLFGGNGSGKSTLIKVLAGVESVNATGSLRAGGTQARLPNWTPAAATQAGLRFVHQDLGLYPDLSVAENLSVGAGFPTAFGGRIRWRQVRAAARQALSRLEVDIDVDRPLGTLRVSEQALVAVARALRDTDDLTSLCLLLDEPTAALPQHEVDVLFNVVRRLAEQGAAILFVSHRIDEVLSLSSHVTILRDGRDVSTEATSRLTKRDLIDALHVTGTASTLSDSRSDAPSATRHTGQTPESLPAHAVAVAAVPAARPTDSAGTPLLLSRRLQVPGAQPVDLSVARGEIVGVAGLLGSGRSALLRTLYGLNGQCAAEILVDDAAVRVDSVQAARRAGFAYLPEQRSALAYADHTVQQNLLAGRMAEEWRHGWFNRDNERATATAAVRDYAVKTASLDLPIRALSGGNQQKVLLARLLITGPRILLLDEPTQGVDVAARAELWQLIRRHCESGGAAIAVSSDPEELSEYVDRVIVWTRHGLGPELRPPHISAAQITAAVNDEELIS